MIMCVCVPWLYIFSSLPAIYANLSVFSMVIFFIEYPRSKRRKNKKNVERPYVKDTVKAIVLAYLYYLIGTPHMLKTIASVPLVNECFSVSCILKRTTSIIRTLWSQPCPHWWKVVCTYTYTSTRGFILYSLVVILCKTYRDKPAVYLYYTVELLLKDTSVIKDTVSDPFTYTYIQNNPWVKDTSL